MKAKSVELKVEGMKCPYCVIGIASAMAQVEGIKELYIDLYTHSVKVIYKNKDIDKEKMERLVLSSVMG